MKKLSYLSAFIFLVSITFTLSCKTEKETIIPEPTDLEATDADFANFASWTLITKATGPAAGLGATTHNNNNANVVRYIYTKTNAARKANGEYPVGTIVIKEYRNTDGTIFNSAPTAMVKRKAGYNADNNNWEYIRLDRATGLIAKDASGNPSRGTALATSCGTCHRAAKDKDMVFTGK